ncbi:MAG TPA: PDZ domain-containing protein [Kofleriaceae bacterium]|nr:PDZ domain-containing protein [Kofleriaceae bacterium]
MRRGLVASSLVVAAGAVAAGAAPAAAEAPGPPVPWLGITFSSDHAQIEVSDVHPGTGAARAGVLVGDDILAIDDQSIGADDLRAVIQESHGVGDRITLTVARDGELLTLAARLTAKPSSGELLEARLYGAALPPMQLLDRHDHEVALDRRPTVLTIFDAHCERCSGPASALVEAAGRELGPDVAVRTVIVGRADEAAAYLSRNPVTGTVLRWDAPPDGPRGLAVLSALDPLDEGAILVVDEAGVVQFAASTADADELGDGAVAAGVVQAGALAAAARADRARHRGAAR